MSVTHVIDLGTSAGMAEHMRTLPTENLREIADREVFYGPVSNVLIVTAAQMELTLRGESPEPMPAETTDALAFMLEAKYAEARAAGATDAEAIVVLRSLWIEAIS